MPTATTATIRQWLTARVAHYLERPPAEIDQHTPLVELGLDSVYAMTLSGDVEEEFDLLVEPTVAWDHPTVAALADFLHDQLASS
ncbi:MULTISPECIES: acyl carrier protein [Amycolatopsis]|uniref:Acyl carrier protein n=1 Tax=Amycolatopsis albidoflavus TaxID=102226 RepID=A0ABW5IA38_9PSEU